MDSAQWGLIVSCSAGNYRKDTRQNLRKHLKTFSSAYYHHGKLSLDEQTEAAESGPISIMKNIGLSKGFFFSHIQNYFRIYYSI